MLSQVKDIIKQSRQSVDNVLMNYWHKEEEETWKNIFIDNAVYMRYVP
jgi:hypothetical protein